MTKTNLSVNPDSINVEDDSFVSACSKDEHISKMCFYRRIWNKYDHSFLIVYGIQYANGSCKFLLMLAVQDLLKNYLKL